MPAGEDLKDAEGPALSIRAGNDFRHVVTGQIATGHGDPVAHNRIDVTGDVTPFRIVRVEARELDRSAARQAEGAHMRPAVGPRAGDDVGNAVAIHVAGRHADGPRERRKVREEAGELRDLARRITFEHAERSGLPRRAGDDLGDSIAVHIAAGHEQATGKRRVISEEAGKFDRAPAGETEGSDVRTAAGSGCSENIRDSIPVDVRDRNPNAADEGGIIGQEVGYVHRGAPDHAEDSHLRGSARARPRNDVGQPITGHIAARDKGPAVGPQVVGVEAHHLGDGPARDTEAAHVWIASWTRSRDDVVQAVTVEVAPWPDPDQRGDRGAVIRGRGIRRRRARRRRVDDGCQPT